MLKEGVEEEVNIVEGHGRSCVFSLSALPTVTRAADVNGPHTRAAFILLVEFSSLSPT